MGRLAVVTNPLRPDEAVWHDWAGPFIDWLGRAYPNGFGARSHRALLNGRTLPVADYDTALGEDDELVLVIAPADPTIIITAVVGALLSTALNFAINALFGSKPDRPSALRTPNPSPTYTLNAPRNRARLGEPIPVQYGRVVQTPDLASQAYSYYADNSQYVSMLLTLGQGQHTVHGLLVSDTPADQLKAGTLAYTVFQPADHGGTLGPIATATGHWENVDTSSEVDQIQLQPAAYQLATAELDASAGELVFAVALVSDIQIGGSVELSNAAPNNGTWTIDSISADRKTVTVAETMSTTGTTLSESTDVEAAESGHNLTITWTGSTDLGNWVNAEISGNLDDGSPAGIDFEGYISAADAGTLTVVTAGTVGLPDDPPTAFDAVTATISPAITADARLLRDGNAAGPYVVCAPGRTTTLVGFDLVWPGGLYTLHDETGTLLPATSEVRLTLTPIDDDGDPTGGADITEDVSLTANTNTPQRRTAWVTATAGRYRASAIQTSQPSGRAQDQSDVYWTGLKAVLPHSGAAYTGTTIVHVLAKATDGLAQDALDRIHVDCTRVISGVSDTGNPADVITDIITDTTYGLGRPAAELDTDTIDDYRAAWAADTARFRGVYDQPMGGWEALRLALQVVSAVPVSTWGQVSLVDDGPRASAAWTFSEDTGNLVRGSARLAFSWDRNDSTDGIEMAYRDPDTFQERVVVHPADAVRPESMSLFGCADTDLAQAIAEREWRKRQYRGISAQWEVEMDGHLPVLGDRVTLVHDRLGGSADYVLTAIEPVGARRVRLSGHAYDTRVWT
jgi:hypothetical protein